MVDIFSLLVSVGMLGVVTLFAIRLDKTREWFERPKNPNPAPKLGAAAKMLRPGPTGLGPARPGPVRPGPARPGRDQRPSRFPGQS